MPCDAVGGGVEEFDFLVLLPVARLVRRDDGPDFLSLVREKFELPGSPEPGAGDGTD